MRTHQLILAVLVGIPVVYLLARKRRKVKCKYQPYFARLNVVLRKQYSGISAAIIDLDRLDTNVDAVRAQLTDAYRLRLVTKSLPSLDLLKYLMIKAQTNRLMVFSEPFVAEILRHFDAHSLDILLGKPLPIEAFVRLTNCSGWNTLHWLIDTDERLAQYIQHAKEKNSRIKICLEIDVGLHRGGFETLVEFAEAVNLIQRHSAYVELTGLVGYDGHVPHVPTYIHKERSIRNAFHRVQAVYGRFVHELKKHYDAQVIRTMIFNSGGSRTYFYYSANGSDTTVNDIALGSALLAPQQYPEVTRLAHQPSLFLTSPVLKKITPSKLPHAESLSPLVNLWSPNLQVSYFMLDGGWPGEVISPAGLQRNPWWDADVRSYTNLLPNQSILSSSEQSELAVGDFAFYHPWEGDGMLCFRSLLLYRQFGLVGTWNTYQGGLCSDDQEERDRSS